MPYIVHALKLSLAARATPLQLCLQDKTCSGCSYMMEYTERVQQGASKASPPACNYYEMLRIESADIIINPLHRLNIGIGAAIRPEPNMLFILPIVLLFCIS